MACDQEAVRKRQSHCRQEAPRLQGVCGRLGSLEGNARAGHAAPTTADEEHTTDSGRLHSPPNLGSTCTPQETHTQPDPSGISLCFLAGATQ